MIYNYAVLPLLYEVIVTRNKEKYAKIKTNF